MFDKCPNCDEPNTGINGYFFFADGEWHCLACKKDFLEDDEKLIEIE